MKRYVTIGILLMLMAPGCAYDKAVPDAYMSKPAAEKMAEAKDPGADISPQQAANKPKIIRTAKVELDSDDLEADFSKIESRTRQLGGYVASTEEDRRSELNRWGSLVVKVPSAHFDDFMNFLKNDFTVIALGTHSQDVTEKYVDLSARLKNAVRQEKRLIKLLETETGNLKEVLMVEQELARVREKI